MMTDPTESRPNALPADLAQMAPLCAIFRRHLKEQNLKYTPERADILNAILEVDDVFEAESLMQMMRDQGHVVSKATVYRTLKLLQEAGIINFALFDSKQSHYQLVYGQAPSDYMVCVETGKFVRISSEEVTLIRDRICREHGWEPVGHRFQVYGIAPDSN